MKNHEGYRSIKENHHTRLVEGGMKFNLIDNRGREIGYKYWINHVTVELLDGPVQDFYVLHREGDPLKYFHADGSVTRDGKTYGASTKGKKFNTQKAAMVYLEKRMTASQKTYASKFAEFNRRAG